MIPIIPQNQYNPWSILDFWILYQKQQRILDLKIELVYYKYRVARFVPGNEKLKLILLAAFLIFLKVVRVIW